MIGRKGRDDRTALAETFAEAVETMPTWARRTIYVSGGVLFAAGFGMSAWALTVLMRLLGVPDPFSITLFLAADAAAVVGVLMWVVGTGALATFGRSLALNSLRLSIAGNVIERALTFRPGPDNDAVARALTTIRALSPTGELGADKPMDLWLATWATFLVTIAIGIVFPVLAYVMAHAVILTRRAVPPPARGRRTTSQPSAATDLLARARHATTQPETRQRTQVRVLLGLLAAAAFLAAGQAFGQLGYAACAVAGAGWFLLQRRRRANPSTEASVETSAEPEVEQTAAPVPESAPPVRPAERQSPARPEPASSSGTGPSPRPRPYVHDPRDLEPGTPEWQARYDRLPGTTKQAKLEHWLELEWDAGREPRLKPVADRVVDGNRTAQNAAKALRVRGIVPPSERRTEQQVEELELAHAS